MLPSSPAAPSDEARRQVRNLAFFMFKLPVAVAVASIGLMVTSNMIVEDLRNTLDEDRAVRAQVLDMQLDAHLEDLVDELHLGPAFDDPDHFTFVVNAEGGMISPRTLPTANQIITATMTGIDVSAAHTKNENDEALTTTPLEALDTDLATADQIEMVTQNLMVVNNDADDALCIGGTTWGDTCGAGDVTCRSGATTDGFVVHPGKIRYLKLRGNERPCVVGVAAISSYDIERVTYKGSEY